MERVFKLTLSMVALCILFASCGKDDDASEYGSFSESLYSKTYSLSQGFIENNGCDKNSVYHYSLTLVSSGLGISYDFSHAYLTGIGNMLHFEIYATDSMQITEGTYNCDYEETGSAGTFNLSDAYVNFNATPDTCSELYALYEGTLTVSRSGNNYVFSLSAESLTIGGSSASADSSTNYLPATIKANYSGPLNYYDYQ